MLMKTKNFLAAIITVIVIGIIIWMVVYYLAPSKPSPLRMGYAPYASNWAFFVAIEKGFFKKEGLDVKAEKFNGSKEMMDALLTKRVDAIAPISLPVIFGVEENSPGTLKITLLGMERNKPETLGTVSGIVVKKYSSITSIEDLKGKKIGTYSGTTALVSLKLILKANDIDPDKEVTIIQVSPELQISAFLSNQFDALFTIEPYITLIETEGYGKVIVRNPRSKYIQDPFIIGGQIFLRDFYEKNPELCKKITKALKKALLFINEHPKEAKKILAKWTIYPERVAVGVGFYEWSDISSFEVTLLQKLADLYYKYGLLKKPLDVSKMCD